VERFYSLYNLDRGVNLAQRVRVAATSRERRKGLLGISEMDRDGGLWIHPCEAIHTFGMKMPIDVIFLDRSYRIRKIRREIGANRISFCISAASVLELAPGTITATGTQLNDRLEFHAYS
jgi:hypothetical protein